MLGAREAVAKGSFHTETHTISRGDVDAALDAAPHVVEGEFELGGQEHFYLEAHAAWAEPGEDGEVFVTSSTQHPSEVQAVVSHVLHLPRHKVVINRRVWAEASAGRRPKATHGLRSSRSRRKRRADRSACSSTATST